MYIILFNVLIYVCIVCVCYVNFTQVRNVHFFNKDVYKRKKESQSYILYTSLLKNK